MEQLRSLFNGTKWKGNTLKYADYCSQVTNRIECAKPSYLELIKEEKEKVNVEVADSTKKEESVARLDPPSGIPNTLLIRKSKRKFFVASINPVYKDEDGNVIAMETESSTNEAHDSSLPENVSIPSTSSDSHVVSTKKCAFPISLTPRHRFIQPEVLCFDLSPVEGTRSNLWDPIPSPKRRRIQTAVPTEEFVKSSIRLDDSSDDSQHEEFLRELEEGNQGNQGKERGVISFESEDEDDGEEKEKQRGYVSFDEDEDEDEDEDNKEENEKKGIEKGIVSFESENEESENESESESESESSHHSNESENHNENEKEVESNHNEIINNETHSETHPSSSESKVSTLPAALLASLENYEEDDLPAPDWYTEEQNSEGNQQEKRENAAQASCCEIDEKQAQNRSKSEEEPKKDAKGGIPENKVICRSYRKRGKESKAGEEE